MNVYDNLEKLGIVLPPPAGQSGVYVSVAEFGQNLAYVSGHNCKVDGKVLHPGRAGAEVSLEEAGLAARQCALNILGTLHGYLGDLNRVKKIVKVLGMVASTPDFHSHPQVINYASNLFVDVFGKERGLAARSAIGVASLPHNISVEIEMLIELYPEND